MNPTANPVRIVVDGHRVQLAGGRAVRGRGAGGRLVRVVVAMRHLEVRHVEVRHVERVVMLRVRRERPARVAGVALGMIRLHHRLHHRPRLRLHLPDGRGWRVIIAGSRRVGWMLGA